MMAYIPTPGPLPGEQFIPSNSDEGYMFLVDWCCQCARDKALSEGVRFCTRQSISQDLNFHGITGVFRDGRFWSADMADRWTPGEVTRWEHAAGVGVADSKTQSPKGPDHG